MEALLTGECLSLLKQVKLNKKSHFSLKKCYYFYTLNSPTTLDQPTIKYKTIHPFKPIMFSITYKTNCTHKHLKLLLLRAGDIETNQGPTPPRANKNRPTLAPFLFPPTQILLTPDTNINFNVPDITIFNIPKFDFQEF